MKKLITIKEINYKVNLKILYYLYKRGKIVGYKQIYNQYAPIIEFSDYTRLWMLPQEINELK
uniref:Cytochrome b6-f complex subunit PetP n=1 Tax=Schimmelmannia schousboei TaxID=173468 RepID=A0A1C9C8H9_9FLOR|nr:hypothetical protein Schim_009 [Schimmelmannia schousboei]AOM64690.1 hypothetical protein Schim_009 [Schimmelmannia schousboei]